MTTQSVATAPTSGRRPRLNTDVPQMWLGIAFVVLTVCVPDMMGNPYWTHSFQLVNLFITVAVLQNILGHDAGQVSFGQSAIFGMGAYMAAIATGIHGINYGWGIIIGVVSAGVAGLLYALPALRVQGFYLGFVTLSAGTVFPELLVAFNKYTNGINGISIPFPGWHHKPFLGLSWLSIAVVLLASGSLAFHVYLRKTKLGRSMRVAATSPEAAQSLGVSPGLMRAVAFLLTAIGTGMAGLLYPPIVGFVSPAAFSLELSIVFFFAMIVGGQGYIFGPVVGVILLYLLPNVLLVEFVNYRMLAYGTAALLVMLAFPDGIVGTIEKWRHRRVMSADRLDVKLESVLGERRAEKLKPTSEVVIDVKKGRKTFGSVVAIDDVDMQIVRGEIHGLVGANGSGKTSLLNVLNGFSRLNAGAVSILGTDITNMPAYRIAKLGVGRTFQTPRIFNSMSLWENIEIGLDAQNDRGGKAAAAPEMIAVMKAAMDDKSVALIPHGQRRLIEVVRVVLKGADILFLDEPAAGLSPAEREEFKALLRRLRDEMGKTIVLVEHDLALVWDIADRITVLETGKVMAQGNPAEIRSNPAVQKLFIEPTHA
jgi:branched-chain amino acid transport system permease protein